MRIRASSVGPELYYELGNPRGVVRILHAAREGGVYYGLIEVRTICWPLGQLAATGEGSHRTISRLEKAVKLAGIQEIGPFQRSFAGGVGWRGGSDRLRWHSESLPQLSPPPCQLEHNSWKYNRIRNANSLTPLNQADPFILPKVLSFSSIKRFF